MELLLHSQHETKDVSLTSYENVSLIYHDIFDYPLTFPELIKWETGKNVIIGNLEAEISFKDGFYFLKGREGLIYKRLLKERVSERKMEIAKKVAYVLSFLPSIKAVLITGALAMRNTKDESDIDLMVIVKRGTLWTTRFISLLLLDLLRIPRRKYGEKNEKDKICLNMWLDESTLSWSKKDRNIYTSHEIAQTTSLINKDKTYEKFIWKNNWIKNFWPNATRTYEKEGLGNTRKKKVVFLEPLERILFFFQYHYMKPKITREIVTPTRAIFHPVNWGEAVIQRLSS